MDFKIKWALFILRSKIRFNKFLDFSEECPLVPILVSIVASIITTLIALSIWF